MPASLDHDDRPGPADAAGRAEEPAYVDDRLHIHIQHKTVRGRIVGEVIDQVGEIDIEHRADTDETAESDVGLLRPVEDSCADGSALAQQGNLSGCCHRRREAGIEIAWGMNDSKTIRADDAQLAAR